MYYKVKKNDTLVKIAGVHNLPLPLILAHNPEITDPNRISMGQLIRIPNVGDVPELRFEFSTLSPSGIIQRARTAVQKGISYQLGSGGMDPAYRLPTKNKLCDCSGFVCWVLGVSRKSEIPFYKRYGGWIYTDSMVDDIKSSSGIFEGLNEPEPGCAVVFGAGNKIGHVGIVSEVANGKMKRVIHCSSGNQRAFNDSIWETSPSVFDRADTLWGRFVG